MAKSGSGKMWSGKIWSGKKQSVAKYGGGEVRWWQGVSGEMRKWQSVEWQNARLPPNIAKLVKNKQQHRVHCVIMNC